MSEQVMRNVYAAIGRPYPVDGSLPSKVVVERINGQVYAIVEEVHVFEADWVPDPDLGMQITSTNIPVDISDY